MGPTKDIPTPVNGKFRSRKFSLAVASFIVATVGAQLFSLTTTGLLEAKLIDGEVWYKAQSMIFYFWLFCDGVILAGYGIPNVIEKWSPKR